jgi:hypothetical protein
VSVLTRLLSAVAAQDLRTTTVVKELTVRIVQHSASHQKVVAVVLAVVSLVALAVRVAVALTFLLVAVQRIRGMVVVLVRLVRLSWLAAVAVHPQLAAQVQVQTAV